MIGDIVFGDINHMLHKTQAPLGRHVAKEINITLEARVDKGKNQWKKLFP